MGPIPKLLFVDEGAPWLLEIRTRLARDYEVVAVETGPQALSMLESAPVAVLITDNHLASVQDRRFGQILKHQHAALPRIVLAARPELEMAIVERNGNRVDAALPKPCNADDLCFLVDRLLGEATVREPVLRPSEPAAEEAEPTRSGLPPAGASAATPSSERETLPETFDAVSGEEG